MKKIISMMIGILLFTLYLSENSYASSLTYQINLQDRYTVTASIMQNIEQNPDISPEDLQIFYSILNELESNGNNYVTTYSLNQLLVQKNLNFINSSSYTTDQYKSESFYKYEDFNVNSEEKALFIDGIKVNYSYIPDGTIKRFIGSSCPIGWDVYGDDIGHTYSITINAVPGVNCIKVGTEYVYSETSINKQVESNYFTTRNKNIISMNYGFTGEYANTNPLVFMILLDDDKLMIWDIDDWNGDLNSTPTYSITKFDHYWLRSQSNVSESWPIEESNIPSEFGSPLPAYKRYFHSLARWNGDTLYQDSNKYIRVDVNGISSFELVYDPNGKRVDDPLVYGTYNFFDAGINCEMHFIADVYPYLIWGNSKLDDSTIFERFIWNNDSYEWGAVASLYFDWDYDYMFKYRGQSLYDKGDDRISNIYSILESMNNQLKI